MREFVVAIPSHKRADSIIQKSIAFLIRQKFPLQRIHVFVSKDQISSYRKSLPKEIQLQVGGLGLPANRRAIQNYFPTGQPIVSMDDDIEDLVQLRSDWDQKGPSQGFQDRFRPLRNFEAFVVKAFEVCSKNGSGLWGIHPVLNPFFMQRGAAVTTRLNFIYGCFYGVFNAPIHTVLSLKDDFERTVMFYRAYGVVVRFNKVAPLQRYKRNEGGLSDLRTLALNNEEVHQLAERFTDNVRIKEKNGGWLDVRLVGGKG